MGLCEISSYICSDGPVLLQIGLDLEASLSPLSIVLAI